MSDQEFVLIPKENYVKKQPKALEIIDEPTTVEKAKLLTVLQRQPQKVINSTDKTQTNHQQTTDNMKARVLKSLSMLQPSKKEKSRSILGKIEQSDKIAINDDGKLELNDRTTSIDANTFLFDLQQNRTKILSKDPDYKNILENLDISPQLIANSQAKQILKPKRLKTVLKAKSPKTTKKTRRQDELQPSEDSEREEETEKEWEYLPS